MNFRKWFKNLDFRKKIVYSTLYIFFKKQSILTQTFELKAFPVLGKFSCYDPKNVEFETIAVIGKLSWLKVFCFSFSKPVVFQTKWIYAWYYTKDSVLGHRIKPNCFSKRVNSCSAFHISFHPRAWNESNFFKIMRDIMPGVTQKFPF